jgi:hypothetical protein
MSIYNICQLVFLLQISKHGLELSSEKNENGVNFLSEKKEKLLGTFRHG